MKTEFISLVVILKYFLDDLNELWHFDDPSNGSILIYPIS